MIDPTTGLLIVLLSLGVGMYGGLLGVGGGALFVPVLHLFFRVPMPEAIVFSLTASALISCAASVRFLRAGTPHLPTVRFLMAGSIPAAALGMTIGQCFSGAWLKELFGLFLLWAFLSSWKTRPHEGSGRSRRPGGYRPARLKKGMIAAIGSLMGFASGLLGIGGGLVSTPLQRGLAGYPVKAAMVNSTLAIVATSAMGVATAVLYRLKGGETALPWGLLAWGVLPVVLGGYLGGVLQDRVHSRLLLRLFAVVLLAVAVRMLWPG